MQKVRPDSIFPLGGLRIWAMKVELTFPVEKGDIAERFEGDAEADFSFRALERVKSHLENLLRDSPFEHYHICQFPRRVIG